MFWCLLSIFDGAVSSGGEAEDTSVSLASLLSDVERRREEERGGGTHAETFMAVSALPTLFHGLPPQPLSAILQKYFSKLKMSDTLEQHLKDGFFRRTCTFCND